MEEVGDQWRPKRKKKRRKKGTTLAINAGVAAVLGAIILPLVFTARSATVFLLPNRRDVRPVAIVAFGSQCQPCFRPTEGSG